MRNSVVITGGAGFLGKHVVRKLEELDYNCIVPRSKYCDLRSLDVCESLLKNSKYCIHLAATVGGIGFNDKNPADLFYDNIIMGVNIIHTVNNYKYKKLVVVGTICAYPKFTTVPFKEEDLWLGYPEETNAPYGIAKKSLLVYLQACRKQYGLNGIFLLPVNLYGIGDSFSEENSHVIPALIKKFYDASLNNTDVTIWGTGNATREFLYVEDCAEGIVKAFLNYNKQEPINLGAGFEISIKDLVNKVATIMEYKGKIIWDKSKPDGQPRRSLNIDKAKKEFNFEAKIDFDVGLRKTIEWYVEEGYESVFNRDDGTGC